LSAVQRTKPQRATLVPLGGNNMQRKQNTRFWLGNAVMVLALVILLFMGTLWQHLGVWAMGLWAVIAAFGGYLLASGKDESPKDPG
jgi:protein-S-isoprenylcysteine O-methyltransferase Ste14